MFFAGKKANNDGDDWVNNAADTIERVIDGVRDKAITPLTTIARGIVYGLLAAIVGVSAIVLFAIAFVRFLDVYLDHIPGAPEGVWLADLIAGAIFVLAGLLAWTKKSPKSANDEG